MSKKSGLKAVLHFEEVIKTFSENVSHQINALTEIAEEGNLGPDELQALQAAIDKLSAHTYPSFADGEKVRVFVAGTDKVFLKGVNSVKGKIIKSGSLFNTYRVLLDKSISKDGQEVVEIDAFSIQRI